MLEELDKSLKEFREQQRELRKKVILLLYASSVFLQYHIINYDVLFCSRRTQYGVLPGTRRPVMIEQFR